MAMTYDFYICNLSPIDVLKVVDIEINDMFRNQPIKTIDGLFYVSLTDHTDKQYIKTDFGILPETWLEWRKSNDSTSDSNTVISKLIDSILHNSTVDFVVLALNQLAIVLRKDGKVTVQSEITKDFGIDSTIFDMPHTLDKLSDWYKKKK